MSDPNNGGMSDMKFRIIITLLLFAPQLFDQNFSGTVVGVSDGDPHRHVRRQG
jgi:hypothetical protein